MSRGRATAWVAAVLVGAALLGACGTDNADVANLSPDARRGYDLAQRKSCTSCHQPTSSAVGGTWLGLYGSTITLTDGTTVVADDAYLTESIKDPAAKVASGYKVAMPANQLTDAEIALVLVYIREQTR